MLLKGRVVSEFHNRFNQSPAIVVRAPGRVNLIGEHTDYNDGFVLPMAINRAVWIALRPRSDRRVSVYSIDFKETAEFALDGLRKDRMAWREYLKGVAWALQEAGHELQGWDGVMAGDVPIGAGLASSAAIEMATARVFAALGGIGWDALKMARLGQRVENGWIGVNSGIMDQTISAGGKAGHALLIDCRSLDLQPVPLPPRTSVVVLDTATRRGLVDSAYNERRSQCERAARFFGVKALRDVTRKQLEVRAGELDELTRKRARHVITEDERTLQAVEVMRRGDAQSLGELMNASHASLRDDFEVSSDALNAIVDCARREPSCLGARMTGAGFGGCAMALVEAEAAAAFAANVAEAYRNTKGLQPNVYICEATNGAESVG
jgi:galactokinase